MKTDKIEQYIDNFSQSIVVDDLQTSIYDNLRDKHRVEILASLLISFVHSDKKNEADIVFEEIKNQKLYPNGYEEKFYGIEDEDIGSYGAIPTSFIAIATYNYIDKYHSNSSKNLRWLLKLGDFIYSTESNGKFIKGTLNRSKALNTDLFMAYSLSKICKKLNKASVRRRMYEECIKRTLFRITSYQFINGSFPYQSDTFKVPYLYHIIVTSLLKNFALELKDAVIIHTYHNAVQYIEKNIINDNKIDWSSANDKDKQGAIWAYSFLLNIYPADHSMHECIMSLLNKASKGGMFSTTAVNSDNVEIDKFYSAWMVISFDLYDDRDVAKHTSKKKLFFYIYRQFINMRCIIKYLRQRFLNYFYHTGAQENKSDYK